MAVSSPQSLRLGFPPQICVFVLVTIFRRFTKLTSPREKKKRPMAKNPYIAPISP